MLETSINTRKLYIEMPYNLISQSYKKYKGFELNDFEIQNHLSEVHEQFERWMIKSIEDFIKQDRASIKRITNPL